MTRSFAVTFDYRCPFARNAHEAVLAGIEAGADWSVTFHAFSLDQVHLDPEEEAVWERPRGERGSGVLALEWGIAVRDHFPERFPAHHLGTFAARHDRGLRIDDPEVLAGVAAAAGLDPDVVAGIVATGEPLATLAGEHAEAVKRWDVFGVPTFIEGEEAVFVRLMERGRGGDIDLVLDLLPRGVLNEFKRTTVPR